jgi:membrane-associated protease RseP (regulator of RpoE activity)
MINKVTLLKYILYISFLLISISLSFAANPDNSSGFGGLGIQISQQGDRILIIGVLPNTPAARANLTPGSSITAIDGESVAGKTLEEIVNKLRGNIGTPVRITVLPAFPVVNGEHTKELELSREFISYPNLQAAVNTTVTNQTTIIGSVRQTVTYYITTIPKPEQVQVGTPIIVRLMVDNPKGAVADRVAMQIQFDPEIFSCSSSILDINSKFSTSWNKATTSINTATGKIYFELRAQSTDLYISGCIAELKLIPRRPVTETAIDYQFNDWEKYPNTVYLQRGKDLLGTEFDHKDGTMGIRFRINKE